MRTSSSTIKRMEKLAAKIRYKPWVPIQFDFYFSIETQCINVTMSTRVPCAVSIPDGSNAVPKIIVNSSDARPVDYFDHMDDKTLIDYLYTTITNFERHEQAEWFTMDGERVFNPHL